jgi:hypothetical protein
MRPMKEIIDEPERLLQDLGRRGRELPVIEKNIKTMMNFIAVLKYEISDIVERRKL